MKIKINSNELVIGEMYHDTPDSNSIELEFAGYSENEGLLFTESIESRKIYISFNGIIPFAKGGPWYKEVK